MSDAAPDDVLPMDDVLPLDAKGLRPDHSDSPVFQIVDAPKPPGPGILESLGWTVGTLIVHLIGVIAAGIGIVVWHMLSQGIQPGDRQAVAELLKSLSKEYGLTLIGMEMAFFVFVAVIAALLRLSPRPLRQLSMAPIPLHHLVLIFTGSIPLALASGGLHQVTTSWWLKLVELVPVLKKLPLVDSNEMLKEMSGAPIWLLFLLIAVAPAVGEELVFRGVIGRGLVARYGMLIGVVLTSILFGVVHGHPAHVLAVIPMGVYMHITYLSTKSFWAPMLVHFLNNGFAVLMLKLSTQMNREQLEKPIDVEAQMPWWIAASCGLIAVLTLVAMWKHRVRHLDRGVEWTPGYDSVLHPPTNSAAKMAVIDVLAADFLLAVVSGFAVSGTFVVILAVQAIMLAR